jgi:aminoglycoside phosphotransferase (APT) family kinase protein
MSNGQMHPAAHPIDDALVRRLVAGQFPQWAGLPVKRFPSGGTVNAMYRLGDDMVVRLPLVQDWADDVLLEREWLPRLAPHLPTPVPEVLGGGEPAEGYPWPWSVYRWLAGENPEAGALNAPVLLAEDLAEFVAAMRSISLPGAPQAYRGGPVATLDAATRAAIEELRGIPEEGLDCDAATAVWEEALRAPGWDCPPVWLHADLMPGNLLVDGGSAAVLPEDQPGDGAQRPACDPDGARRGLRPANFLRTAPAMAGQDT